MTTSTGDLVIYTSSSEDMVLDEIRELLKTALKEIERLHRKIDGIELTVNRLEDLS